MNKKGFVLIELLVVVAVVGVLSAIAVPRYSEARDRAFVTSMQADLNQIRTAQEIFYQTNGFSYTDDIDDLTGANLYSPTDGVTATINSGDESGWDGSATHQSTAVGCGYDSTVGSFECSSGGGGEGRRTGGGASEVVMNFFEMLGELLPE